MALLSFKRREFSKDWSNQELGQFYRVEGLLVKLGLRLEIDRGVSDEGDPWLIFLNTEHSVVLIHFCKIDGFYCICSDALNISARDRDLKRLIEGIVGSLPTLIPQKRSSNFSVVVHPSSMLLALVFSIAFAFDNSNQAFADTPDGTPENEASSLEFNSSPKEPSGLKSLATTTLNSTDRNAILFGAIVLAGISASQIEQIIQIGNTSFKVLTDTTITSSEEVKDKSNSSDEATTEDKKSVTKASILDSKSDLRDDYDKNDFITNYQISNDDQKTFFSADVKNISAKTDITFSEIAIQTLSEPSHTIIVFPDSNDSFTQQDNHASITTELKSDPPLYNKNHIIAHTAEKFDSLSGWLSSLNLSLSDSFVNISSDRINLETGTAIHSLLIATEPLGTTGIKTVPTEIALGPTGETEKLFSDNLVTVQVGSDLVARFLNNDSDYKITVQGTTTIVYDTDIVGSSSPIYTETFTFSDGSHILLIGSLHDHLPMLV